MHSSDDCGVKSVQRTVCGLSKMVRIPNSSHLWHEFRMHCCSGCRQIPVDIQSQSHNLFAPLNMCYTQEVISMQILVHTVLTVLQPSGCDCVSVSQLPYIYCITGPLHFLSATATINTGLVSITSRNWVLIAHEHHRAGKAF